MATEPAQGVVRIRLETSGLSDDSIEKINRALQNTLMSQLAELAVMREIRLDLGLPTDKAFTDLFATSDLFRTLRTDGIVAPFPIPFSI